MSTKRWIDLSAEGLYLGSIRMSDGVERLSLIDVNDKADPAKLREIGFLPFEGSPRFERGIYYLGEGRGLSAQLLAQAVGLARAPIVDVKAAEVEKVFRAKCLQKFQANINAAALRCVNLGVNANGHTVYQGAAGRFVRTGPSEVLTERGAEGAKSPRALFLRADNDEDLRSCAQGFVGRVLGGEKLDWSDATKFGAVVFGKAPSDGQMHRLQEAIEACAYAAFAQRANTPDVQAFRLATDFYFGLPTARMRTAESVYLQQYSTPMPMSVIAQRVLVGRDAVDGKSVLEPAGGNGGLLNLLPREMRLFALELDRKRAAVLAANPRVIAQVGDATGFGFRDGFDQEEGFDYTIANPPFGALEQPRTFDKLPNVRRIDHYIALRALEARKPGGRSVMILAADSAQSKGAVEGGSRNLLNYLHDHYEVHGAVEVDGRLYSRQGSGYNVRLLVVGPRRAQPIRADVPTVLPILTTYEELWGWGERVVNAYPAPRAVAAPTVDPARDAEAEPELEPGDIVMVVGGRHNGTVRSLVSRTSTGYRVSDTVFGSVEVGKVAFRRRPGAAAGADAPVGSAAPATPAEIVAPEEMVADLATIDVNAKAVFDGANAAVRRRALDDGGQATDTPALGRTAAATSSGGNSSEGAAARVATSLVAPVPERRVNEFQAPYQPASKGGPASSMIPINMAGATYAALNRLEAEFGPIDDFVADKLRYPVDKLRELFSPEQVDALGLGIQAVDAGRGVINADQTGMGKGRYVAGMMRYAKVSGKLPVFLTIKPELFTDIFRDMSDIESQDLFKRLFIFNDGVNVMKFGTEDQVLYRATSVQERRKALAERDLDADVDMVLATYSQFARAGAKNLKTQLLGAISQKDTMLFLDEAHVASGASNTSEAVGDAVANSAGVVYSSATPLKGVSNFAIYSKVFPASVDLMSLPETLKSGGEALQEAISANMARDGVLIRREHDFSKLTFVTRLPDEKRQAHNIVLANKLAAILSGMSFLSGDIAKQVGSANKKFEKAWEEIPQDERKGTRMRASSMNFGSRLYALNRQFLLGIKVDECVEGNLEYLQAGCKPVIALENTGEALLRSVIARRAGVAAFEEELQDLNEREGSLSDEERLRRDTLRDKISASIKAVRLDEPPQYRELLEIMLERVGEIKIQGRYGEVTTTRPDSEAYLEAEARVLALIRDFPDLHLAPLDVITHELEVRGFSVAEISGRTCSISKTSEGWAPEFHAKADAVANVAGFQSGKHDVAIITRSGSTGISLHATDRFADSDVRQRVFFALQKAANIADFLQWLGRVNRKDQVSSPIIVNLESGLPAERRLTMMHNAKLRKLSANTTSNRENGSVEGDDSDWLNEVGDAVALDWLCENPEVAEELDIALPKDADEEGMSRLSQEAPYVNKLMGRLMMVDVSRQLDVLRVMALRFNDRVAELEQRGENPFKINVYEWGAQVVKKEELQSGVLTPTDSTFDEAVTIVTLSYEQDVKPIRKDRLLSMIGAGLEGYKASAPLDGEGRLDKFKAALRGMAGDYLRKQLPVKLRDSEDSLAAILASNDLPMVKKARDKQTFLMDNLDYFKPGAYVVHTDLFKGEQKGVVTSVDFPASPEDAFLLSKYLLRVTFPGEERTKELSLATIFNEGGSLAAYGYNLVEPARIEQFGYLRDRVEKLLRPFEEAPDGRVTRKAHVLQGNLFRACELAHAEKLGSPILFSDANGNRQRAVLLKDRVTPDMVKALPLAFDAADALNYVREFLRPDHAQHKARTMFGAVRLFDGAYKDMKRGDGVMVEVLQGGREFRLTLPGTKLHAGDLMTDGTIFDIGEKTPTGSLRLKLSGSRAFMSADVSVDRLGELLNRLQRGRHVGKFYVPSPEQDVLTALKAQYEAAAERLKAERRERASRPGSEDTFSPEP